MARAAEHLASARYAEAAGAFRAVLRIDPTEFRAHFGLADALVARGQRAEAIEGLVSAAEACSEQDDHAAALTLYGKALAIDPGRLELHLDVAMAEAALGRMDAAQGRLEHLAEVYMRSGRTDEAAEVYRCLAGWEADAEEDEEDGDEEGEAYEEAEAPPAAPAQAAPPVGVPMHVTTTETVVVPTVLITPDGQLFQVPIERQTQGHVRKVKIDDSVPPIPADLIEVAHSAPIDVADESELDDVEGTVVAYPPPPPVLPEQEVDFDRQDLEAAVVAALDNLAQLEEEDMTLVMQRLPPQPKNPSMRRRLAGETRLPEFITKTNMRKPEIPKREPAGGGGKLRVRPAPRPTAGEAPVAEAPAPAPAERARPAAPGRGAGPGMAPPARAAGVAPKAAATPSPTPGRAAAGPGKGAPPSARGPAPARNPAPARGPAPNRPAPSSAAQPPASARSAPLGKGPAAPGRAAPGPGKGAPASARPQPAPSASAARPPAKPTGRDVPPPGTTTGAKPVRPNNPLAERLRRRAGLTGPQPTTARAAQPRPAPARPTEPISVRTIRPTKK